MRLYQIVPIIVIALALPASAQQSDRPSIWWEWAPRSDPRT